MEWSDGAGSLYLSQWFVAMDVPGEGLLVTYRTERRLEPVLSTLSFVITPHRLVFS